MTMIAPKVPFATLFNGSKMFCPLMGAFSCPVKKPCKTTTPKQKHQYQGIVDYHEWSLIPIKKSKPRPLSAEEKAFNRRLVP